MRALERFVVIAAIGVGMTASRAVGADQGGSEGEWSIRPEGLGRIDLRQPVSVAQARERYPEAKVEIRKGRFGRREPAGFFYVFADSEREMFGIRCDCWLDEGGQVRFPGKAERDEAHTPAAPLTEDPRFRTDQGIRVGSTVRDLQRAYPEHPRTIYFQAPATAGAPNNFQYVAVGTDNSEPIKI